MRDPEHTEDQAQRSTEDVLWALHQFVVAAAALDVTLGRRLDLGPTAYQAMKHLMTTGHALGPVELGTLVGLTSGSATSLADRLERAGHLTRRRDHHDRRRLTLEPTPSAVTKAQEQLQPLEDALNAVLAHYSPDERRTISRFLTEAVGMYQDFNSEIPT